MKGPTKRERLIAMIEAHGFTHVRLYPSQGAWRTNHRLDVQPWTGSGKSAGYMGQPHGITVSFSSWSTMTELVKAGIDIRPDQAWWSLDVIPKCNVVKS